MGNVLDTSVDLKDQSGGLNFSSVLESTDLAAAQKIACFLCYFQASRELEGSDDECRQVHVERQTGRLEGVDLYQWICEESKAMPYNPNSCVLHEDCMEAIEDADAFVNFANRVFGFGRFISSCTQEEI